MELQDTDNFGSITSRVKGICQRRSGVLWKVQKSQVRPLGCSPSMLDALLRLTSTPSAQLFHMDCEMQLTTRAAGCVRAQHALARQWCAQALHACAGVRPLHVCTHDMRTSSLLDFAPIWKITSTSCQASWSPKDDRKLVIPKMMCTRGRVPAALHLLRLIDLLLLEVYQKQTDSLDTQHTNESFKLVWRMWSWHPVWPPSTSLSLGKWYFSSQIFIDIYTHQICANGKKKRCAPAINTASQRLRKRTLGKILGDWFLG